MQRGIRPVRRPAHIAVLDRVDMDVVDVIPKIVFVHDRVFLEPALPDATFAFGDARIGTTFCSREPAGESGFDACPAIRVVGIAFGQPPQAMQMFLQHHDNDHVEGACTLRSPECGTQVVDAFHQQPAIPPLQQVDGGGAGAKSSNRINAMRETIKTWNAPPDRSRAPVDQLRC